MYEFFEHTADLGLRIRAPDLDTLFVEAAQALFAAIIEDPSTVRPERQVTVELAAESLDYLLFDWLRTLLCRFEVEHLVFGKFQAHVMDLALAGAAWGEPLDPARHPLGHEVKAITYHGLRVVSTADGWLAEVIVDI